MPPKRPKASFHPGAPVASAFIALSALTGPDSGPVKPWPLPDPKDGPPCHLCTARCCKYFALAIDTPVTPEDHDYIRWFLMHAHVVAWRQDGDWYLEVRTPCQHLQPDNACGIYETRPQICRDYGLPEKAEDATAPCEYFTDDAAYDLFFDTADAFYTWSKAELEKRAARLARRRARRREKILGEGDREAIA
jgi:Fe-S-cluster containining protein